MNNNWKFTSLTMQAEEHIKQMSYTKTNRG